MKNIFLIACLLILFGAVIIGVSVGNIGNVEEIIYSAYETRTVNVTDDFDMIVIDIDTADVSFATSDNDYCYIVSHDHTKVEYEAEVYDGKLMLTVNDTRTWLDMLGIGSENELTVYLPKTEYNALSIYSSTGDVVLPKEFSFGDVYVNLSTGDVEIRSNVSGDVEVEATTGDIELSNISCGSITLTVTTGDISLYEVTALGNVKCNRGSGASIISGLSCTDLITVSTTGDSDIENVTASGKVSTTTNTGSVNLTNVSCQSLVSDGNTGDLTLNNVIAADMFEIMQGTGDITFDLCDARELSVETTTGRVSGTLLTSKIFTAKTSSGRIDVPDTTEGGVCRVKTTSGSIKITIAENNG